MPTLGPKVVRALQKSRCIGGESYGDQRGFLLPRFVSRADEAHQFRVGTSFPWGAQVSHHEKTTSLKKRLRPTYQSAPLNLRADDRESAAFRLDYRPPTQLGGTSNSRVETPSRVRARISQLRTRVDDVPWIVQPCFVISNLEKNASCFSTVGYG